MSWYLTIRSDAGYSQFADTAPLLEFLATMPRLRRSGPVAFESASDVPWVRVMIAICSVAGSYALDGSFLPRVNVVEFVCPHSGEPEWYEAIAGHIAAFLG